MVRRRYYYRRTSRPKQKWAINTVNSTVSASADRTINVGSSVSCGVNVCRNETRINNPANATVSAAQILKTGRWKFKGIITNVSTSLFYVVYLVYVPEGYLRGLTAQGSPNYDLNGLESEDLFYSHPEWVIAWTRKDYVSIEQSNEISLTSRLKRNLNTGDNVQLRVLIQNIGSGSINLTSGIPIIRGTVSYCCRAN